jgi:hypothetical protein
LAAKKLAWLSLLALFDVCLRSPARCRTARAPSPLSQRFEAFSDFVYRCRFGGVHSYRAQTPPCHRRHLRTARRVWRTVVLATQTPLTRVLPGPHAAATCITMLSDWGIGAGVIACAEVARAKAKPATAINLIILLLLFYRVFAPQTLTGAQTRSGSCESFVNCEAARIAATPRPS